MTRAEEGRGGWMEIRAEQQDIGATEDDGCPSGAGGKPREDFVQKSNMT